MESFAKMKATSLESNHSQEDLLKFAEERGLLNQETNKPYGIEDKDIEIAKHIVKHDKEAIKKAEAGDEKNEKEISGIKFLVNIAVAGNIFTKGETYAKDRVGTEALNQLDEGSHYKVIK